MAYWDVTIERLDKIIDDIDHVVSKMAQSNVADHERRILNGAADKVTEARNSLIIDRYNAERRKSKDK